MCCPCLLRLQCRAAVSQAVSSAATKPRSGKFTSVGLRVRVLRSTSFRLCETCGLRDLRTSYELPAFRCVWFYQSNPIQSRRRRVVGESQVNKYSVVERNLNQQRLLTESTVQQYVVFHTAFAPTGSVSHTQQQCTTVISLKWRAMFVVGTTTCQTAITQHFEV